MNQLENAAFDLHLFPYEPHALHPGLRNVTLHHPIFQRRPLDELDIGKVGTVVKAPLPAGPWESRWSERVFDPSVRQRGLWWPFRRGRERIEARLADLFPTRMTRSARLASTIERLKPDIVHSLEITTGGYLTLAARSQLESAFPAWIVSDWGSDLQLFGRLADHEPRMREVLAHCQYYMTECVRDVALARAFGFAGKALPVVSNAGGFDLERIRHLRQDGLSSARRLILLKGYQGRHGRALVALHAIEMAVSQLLGYRVAMFGAPPDVRIAAELMSRRTNIPVEIVPLSPHDEIMRLHGRARISIGLSISDGIPTSLIEAMAMGSFPIQSDTSCASEWIIHGTTGLIVPAEDPQSVAAAIRLAVTEDALVDRAAELNAELVRKRLDESHVRLQVVEIYKKVADEHRTIR
jgi:glycosyltransferase involved in cell wall biosynthesis